MGMGSEKRRLVHVASSSGPSKVLVIFFKKHVHRNMFTKFLKSLRLENMMIFYCRRYMSLTLPPLFTFALLGGGRPDKTSYSLSRDLPEPITRYKNFSSPRLFFFNVDVNYHRFHPLPRND